jgi:hypothetical protein
MLSTLHYAIYPGVLLGRKRNKTQSFIPSEGIKMHNGKSREANLPRETNKRTKERRYRERKKTMDRERERGGRHTDTLNY